MSKKTKAFTLIELLVVISIVGIISGIVVVQMNGAINATRDATKKTDLNTIKKALTIYKAETGNAYPTESGCNIGSCTNLDVALSGIMPTKMAGDYTYSSNGTSYTVSSVLSSGYAYSYNSSTDSFSTAEPIAGSCGTANGKTYSSLITSYGSDTICATGTQNPTTVNFPDAGSSSSWTCVGQNSGTTASCSASRNAAISCPSSATCSTVGTDMIIKWTTVGSYNWTVPSSVTNADIVIVGGGGGGGYSLGGGGGGGFVEKTAYSISGNVAIVVGAGGVASSTYSSACNGSASSITVDGITITANGGGAGAYSSGGGYSGGSGGGGSSGISGGSSSQSTSGYSAGYGFGGGIGDGAAGGGGGGAGAAGGNYTDLQNGGVGGAGRVSSITGAATYYAGGGGGASGTGSRKSGGLGGGGYGGKYNPAENADSGTNGLGGGGGGGYSSYAQNGSGGSGIVIVRFTIP